MNRFASLTRLELRDRWIRFHLLTAVALLVCTATPMLLLPPSLGANLAGAPPDRLEWLAVLTAAALAVVAALTARAAAAARHSGSAAWLVLRAVPRASLLLSWFAADAIVLAIGLAAAAALVWAVGGADVSGAGPLTLAFVYLGIFMLGAASLTVGLLIGMLVPVLPAALLTATIVGALLEGGLLLLSPREIVMLPTAPLGVLASIDTAGRPIATSLEGGGTALVLAAVLMVLALARLRGSDL